MPIPATQPAPPSCAVGGAAIINRQAMTIPAAQPFIASFLVVVSRMPAYASAPARRPLSRRASTPP